MLEIPVLWLQYYRKVKKLKVTEDLNHHFFQLEKCLANVPALRDYFRSEDFVEDINEDNVLGTGGAAAWAFHRLLEQLWNGKNTAVKPSEVKVIFRSIEILNFLRIF